MSIIGACQSIERSKGGALQRYRVGCLPGPMQCPEAVTWSVVVTLCGIQQGRGQELLGVESEHPRQDMAVEERGDSGQSSSTPNSKIRDQELEFVHDS